MPEIVKSDKHTLNPQQSLKASRGPLTHNEPGAPSEATTASYLKATSSESTDILEKRLESWRTVVKDLINYFDEISDTELSTSKGLEKSSTYIDVPFKEAHFFGDDSKPGVQNLLAQIRNHSHQQSLYYRNSSENITNVTIKDLKQLRDDIKYRIKEVKSDYNSLNSKLARTRDNSISHFKSLSRATTDREDATSPDNDPWLVNHSFQRQLHKDVNEENNYNRTIENSIKSLENFEESIVSRIKQIIDQYYTDKSKGNLSFDQQAEVIRQLSNSFDNGTEWRAFGERNPDIVPVAPAKVRTVEDLQQPFKESGLLETIRTGVLERKSGIGMFKSWKEYFFVLTGSGFLHAFSSSDYHNQKEPDFSIPLRKATLTPHLEDKKDSPYAFEVTDQSSGGVFSSEKTYLLRANNQSDLDAWYKDLSMRADRTLSVHSDRSGVSPYAVGAGAAAVAGTAGAAAANRHHSTKDTGIPYDNLEASATSNAPPHTARTSGVNQGALDSLATASPTAVSGLDNTTHHNQSNPAVQGQSHLTQGAPLGTATSEARPLHNVSTATATGAAMTGAGVNETHNIRNHPEGTSSNLRSGAAMTGAAMTGVAMNEAHNARNHPEGTSSNLRSGAGMTGAGMSEAHNVRSHPEGTSSSLRSGAGMDETYNVRGHSDDTSSNLRSGTGIAETHNLRNHPEGSGNDIYRKSLAAAGMGAAGGAAASSMVSGHRADDAQRMAASETPNLTSQRSLNNRSSTEAIYDGDGLMTDEQKRNAAIIGNTPKFDQAQNSYPDQVTITAQGQERIYVPLDPNSAENRPAGPMP
ncbi:PH-domain-containing protein [Neoconidiobolus thromboides FSU 785]|nr:PH-domain-containing protein [Neoconidiobolus thromboides FSU 785]